MNRAVIVRCDTNELASCIKRTPSSISRCLLWILFSAPRSFTYTSVNWIWMESCFVHVRVQKPTEHRARWWFLFSSLLPSKMFSINIFELLNVFNVRCMGDHSLCFGFFSVNSWIFVSFWFNVGDDGLNERKKTYNKINDNVFAFYCCCRLYCIRNFARRCGLCVLCIK